MKFENKPLPGGSSRSIDLLVPEIRDAAKKHLSLCSENGIVLLIYCTVRDEWEQARLFRQNRPLPLIEAKAVSLRKKGFPRLAEILMEVGPQGGDYGPRVTKAGPGESAHQHAVAYDCVPLRFGKPVWGASRPEDAKLWKKVQTLGVKAGLEILSWERPHFEVKGFNQNLLEYMRERYE